MITTFFNIKKIPSNESIVLIGEKFSDFKKYSFNQQELNFIKSNLNKKNEQIIINQYNRWIFIQLVKNAKTKPQTQEKIRKEANKYHAIINKYKINSVTIFDLDENIDRIFSFAEGLALSNYQFLKYIKDSKEKEFSLKKINIFCPSLNEKSLSQLQVLVQSVYHARDLVNEPLSYLTAVQLSEEVQKLGKEAGFSVEVFNKKKIESLKMGGLLAVNKGSIDPPTFSILEWKPKNALNNKPFILVGKGIVYDTGGLSLKPTSSMDTMKCDMAGAAAVIGTIYAISKANLPVHVIGLIPATDNRPDGNAYTPGDVINMYDGSTVEVLNTDAEGRMILADALSYAKQYKPQLVIDLATLTGAAWAAVGTLGIVAMGTAGKNVFRQLNSSGFNVYERIVEFPFWEEYSEMLKSDIADIKNIGGKVAGAITAGKFLEKFTDYPWVHLDIAGTAFLDTTESYRGKGGTGSGIRLLFDFFQKQID